MLVVPPDDQLPIDLHFADVRLKPVGEKPEQGGFAASVGPDESDARLGVHRESQVFVNWRISPGDGVPRVEHRDRRPVVGGRRERERHRVLLRPLQQLGLPRRLEQLLNRLLPRNRVLPTLDLLQELLLRLIRLQRRLVSGIRAVQEVPHVTLVRHDLVGEVVQVQNVAADAGYEIRAVTHDERRHLRARRGGQVRRQPQRRRQVQVVRGLVQQKQPWLDEQRLRQRRSHPPTSGKFRQRSDGIDVAETQTGEDAPRLGLRRVRVPPLELLAELAQSLGGVVPRGVVPLAHPVRLRRLHRVDQFGFFGEKRLGHVVA